MYNKISLWIFKKKGIEPFMNDEYNKRIEVQDLTETPPIEEPARQYFFIYPA